MVIVNHLTGDPEEVDLRRQLKGFLLVSQIFKAMNATHLVPNFYFGTQLVKKLRFDRQFELIEAELLEQIRPQTEVLGRELRLKLTPMRRSWDTT